jgi:hypothetical protein
MIYAAEMDSAALYIPRFITIVSAILKLIWRDKYKDRDEQIER